jgi:hypothetical protein
MRTVIHIYTLTGDTCSCVVLKPSEWPETFRKSTEARAPLYSRMTSTASLSWDLKLSQPLRLDLQTGLLIQWLNT